MQSLVTNLSLASSQIVVIEAAPTPEALARVNVSFHKTSKLSLLKKKNFFYELHTESCTDGADFNDGACSGYRDEPLRVLY